MKHPPHDHCKDTYVGAHDLGTVGQLGWTTTGGFLPHKMGDVNNLNQLRWTTRHCQKGGKKKVIEKRVSVDTGVDKLTQVTRGGE